MTEEEKEVIQKFLETYLEFGEKCYVDDKLIPRAINKGITTLLYNDILTAEQMSKELAKDFKLFFPAIRIKEIDEEWMKTEYGVIKKF